ncbi:MAG TPA: DUF2442 domain-containing protein [Roseiflexaceae bacterium]|nr:DUF2442 domain-containing protein [Roseiflexaceae bacterium]
MSTVTIDITQTFINTVTVTDQTLTVDLSDGRTISLPLAWYPRLLAGTPGERQQWRLIGRGQGVHWPALDEDISVVIILAGQPSSESQRSLQRWLAQRQQAPIG